MIFLIVTLVLLAVVAFWGVAGYNRLVGLRNGVKTAWSQVDTELKRRHDLIPNLVETVKGYASHERGTFEEVTRARAAATAPGQTPAQQAASENLLSQALGRLIAVAEAYPDLKANENFNALQSELVSTEDRVASARQYYNAKVEKYNTTSQSVPTNIVANMFNFEEAEFFAAEGMERVAPQVDFGFSDEPRNPD